MGILRDAGSNYQHLHLVNVFKGFLVNTWISIGIGASINIRFATSSCDFILLFLRNSTLSSKKKEEKAHIFKNCFKFYSKKEMPVGQEELTLKCSHFCSKYWTNLTLPWCNSTKNHLGYYCELLQNITVTKVLLVDRLWQIRVSNAEWCL